MPDLEAICVNDGSADDTESGLERCARNDSRVRRLPFRRNGITHVRVSSRLGLVEQLARNLEMS